MIYHNNYELYHHGIKGQKWGLRRFQNEDGTRTAAGKRRYVDENGQLTEKGHKKYGSQDNYEVSMLSKKGVRNLSNDEIRRIKERRDLEKSIKKGDEETRRILLENGLKAARTVGTFAAVALGSKYVIDHLPDIATKVARATTQATVSATKEVAKGGVELVTSAGKAVAKGGHEVRKAAALSKTGRNYVKAFESIVGRRRR